MTDATPFLPGLSPVGTKPLTAAQDGGQLSSNGGLVLLREIARKLDLATVVAGPLARLDSRDPARVLHTYAHMVTARMMAIAAGYEDCDDLDALRDDPALKIACERAPESGAGIASQPTLSRLENLPDRRTLVEIGLGFIDLFCHSFGDKPPERITLDIDDTDDPAHGQQVLAMFNSHAGTTCFQPMLIFEAGSGKPVFAMIRPGKRPSGKEIAHVLRRVIGRIRSHWPKVKILVRGDSHYCGPQVLDLLEKLNCDYILGLAVNARLAATAAPWKAEVAARRQRQLWQARAVRCFHRLRYGADSWSKKRLVIARVEATAMGTDVRFVVTNLAGRAKHLYEKVYCARGSAENLIKDFKRHTRADKTACHRWQANQMRLFLHMGAYWLLNTMRRAAPVKSDWHNATFATIREKLVKVAVRVEELKSRIKLSFPVAMPDADVMAAILSAVGLSVPARGS